MGKTIYVPVFEKRTSAYRIVSYVDTMDCIPCRLQLEKWKNLEGKLGQRNYDVVFITRPILKDTLCKLIDEAKLLNSKVVVEKQIFSIKDII